MKIISSGQILSQYTQGIPQIIWEEMNYPGFFRNVRFFFLMCYFSKRWGIINAGKNFVLQMFSVCTAW